MTYTVLEKDEFIIRIKKPFDLAKVLKQEEELTFEIVNPHQDDYDSATLTFLKVVFKAMMEQSHVEEFEEKQKPNII